jgi:hypothetical protein
VKDQLQRAVKGVSRGAKVMTERDDEGEEERRMKDGEEWVGVYE